jgi:hypothetical protein
VCFSIEKSGWLLWTWWWIFKFHKLWEISWLADDLLAFPWNYLTGNKQFQCLYLWRFIYFVTLYLLTLLLDDISHRPAVGWLELNNMWKERENYNYCPALEWSYWSNCWVLRPSWSLLRERFEPGSFKMFSAYIWSETHVIITSTAKWWMMNDFTRVI